MTEAAASAGKAIYCEKPLALKLADAVTMRDAVQDAGVASLRGIIIFAIRLSFMPRS